MSAEKEMRDEAFRDWKRALIAREQASIEKQTTVSELERKRRWIVKPRDPEEARQYWEGADIEAREREAIEETMKEFKDSIEFLKGFVEKGRDEQADGHKDYNYE